MDRWTGKVALVTGANSVVGAAIAEELARHGLRVIGLARKIDKVEELKEKMGLIKGELVPWRVDISKQDEVARMFQWIRHKYGSLHVLVNSAGIAHHSMLVDGRIDHFKEVLDVNVLGLAICTQQAFKLMKDTGVDDGHIIHINSFAGHKIPYPEVPLFNVYPASKFAVTALTETLRQELRYLKSKIRVSCISPGIVESEPRDACLIATENDQQDDGRKLLSAAPSLKPKDIADAVMYVISTPPHVQGGGGNTPLMRFRRNASPRPDSKFRQQFQRKHRGVLSI